MTPIIERALAGGQTVVLPWIAWAQRELVARRVTRYPGDLEATRQGLRQPKASCPAVEVGLIDLVVTPGLGFDGYGGRLGRGGGCYDRFFATPGLTAWPDGSLIVKDGWEGPSLKFVAAMEKRGGEWFWVEWDEDGDAKYSGAPSLCTGCHASGSDFVRAFSLTR